MTGAEASSTFATWLVTAPSSLVTTTNQSPTLSAPMGTKAWELSVAPATGEPFWYH